MMKIGFYLLIIIYLISWVDVNNQFINKYMTHIKGNSR